MVYLIVPWFHGKLYAPYLSMVSEVLSNAVTGREVVLECSWALLFCEGLVIVVGWGGVCEGLGVEVELWAVPLVDVALFESVSSFSSEIQNMTCLMIDTSMHSILSMTLHLINNNDKHHGRLDREYSCLKYQETYN